LTGEDALDEEEAVEEKEGDLVKEEEGYRLSRESRDSGR